MPALGISAAIRDRVAARARWHCEYCKSPSAYSTSPCAVEHIQPRSKGGTNDESNLARAFMGCNDHKYNEVQAADPVTGEMAQLYNPRQHHWRDQFLWTPDFERIIAHSAIGRATLSKLKLNRGPLINLRRVLRLAGEPWPDSN